MLYSWIMVYHVGPLQWMILIVFADAMHRSYSQTEPLLSAIDTIVNLKGQKLVLHVIIFWHLLIAFSVKLVCDTQESQSSHQDLELFHPCHSLWHSLLTCSVTDDKQQKLNFRCFSKNPHPVFSCVYNINVGLHSVC